MDLSSLIDYVNDLLIDKFFLSSEKFFICVISHVFYYEQASLNI